VPDAIAIAAVLDGPNDALDDTAIMPGEEAGLPRAPGRSCSGTVPPAARSS
jgi:hypothetical protein